MHTQVVGGPLLEVVGEAGEERGHVGPPLGGRLRVHWRLQHCEAFHRQARRSPMLALLTHHLQQTINNRRANSEYAGVVLVIVRRRRAYQHLCSYGDVTALLYHLASY